VVSRAFKWARDLVGSEGAAFAGMIGPAGHPRLEDGAVQDQLAAVLEQVERPSLASGPFEFVDVPEEDCLAARDGMVPRLSLNAVTGNL
jgi:hypothetical protein